MIKFAKLLIKDKFTIICLTAIVITELIVNKTWDSAFLFIPYGFYKIIIY